MAATLPEFHRYEQWPACWSHSTSARMARSSRVQFHTIQHQQHSHNTQCQTAMKNIGKVLSAKFPTLIFSYFFISELTSRTTLLLCTASFHLLSIAAAHQRNLIICKLCNNCVLILYHITKFCQKLTALCRNTAPGHK